MISDVDPSIIEAIEAITRIARQTLVEQGTHLPTAILHTWEGMLPMPLPFKDDDQKQALVDYVKAQVTERRAYAVTTVTVGRVVDSRTGQEEECLVVATVIQPGRAYVVTQRFHREEPFGVIRFGELVEGDEAFVPGQMMIFPFWTEEVCH